MIKFVRNSSLATAFVAAALLATPAQAVPSSNGDATARARILKPLVLTMEENLNLGDITIVGTGSGLVSLAQDGTMSCPGIATCTGTRTVARYNVAGTQGQLVNLTVPGVTLTGPGGATLPLTPLAPATVTLSNSGVPGDDFNIGGQITVSDTTVDGVYTGVFAVTAQYQ